MSVTTQNPDAAPLQRSLHILYADDVQELREVTRISLSREGHTIECASDGDEALAVLTERPDDYDVLITDHHMPRMDGLTLVTQLRSLPFHGKIVVFSSSLPPDVEAAYRALNVDHIVFKPVYPSVVRELLLNF